MSFIGGPADYIANVMAKIAGTSASDWYQRLLATPCSDRDIFTSEEWAYDSWAAFHAAVVRWHRVAARAQSAPTRAGAIEAWQLLMGQNFFPATVTS